MYKQFKLEVLSNPTTPEVDPLPPVKRALQREKSIVRPEPKEGDKEWKPLQRHKSSWEKDVMISYSHQNKNSMRQLREGLEKRGVSVWVDESGLKAGVDFLSKIGEAIIDAKCFITLQSEHCIKSKYCQDELALAYVSSKPIFPVGLDTPENLFPIMDTGMKLQLARFNWHVLIDPDIYEATIEDLVAGIHEKIAPQEEDEEGEKGSVTTESSDNKSDKKLQRRQFNKQSMKKSVFAKRMESTVDTMTEDQMIHFWDNHFGKETSAVPWPEFEAAINKDYSQAFDLIYRGDEKDWLMSILRRELEVDHKTTGKVLKEIYVDFCTVDDEFQPFWLRVQDQAVESYTMKEVFSMDSSVRIEAIENLGKFRSVAVVEALLDLLSDTDNNVRAVAAISLARTGDNSAEVINALRRTLSDKDRLVRESGCLALGHLKATTAVRDILHLWRNDFISHVREAAQVALEQIGGEEAEKAIHMTKVLSEEIRFLTNE